MNIRGLLEGMPIVEIVAPSVPFFFRAVWLLSQVYWSVDYPGVRMISEKGFPFDVDTGLVMCPVCGSNSNALIGFAMAPENGGCQIDLRCKQHHSWQMGLERLGESLFLFVAEKQMTGLVCSTANHDSSF
jgi:hypothetical protein